MKTAALVGMCLPRFAPRLGPHAAAIRRVVLLAFASLALWPATAAGQVTNSHPIEGFAYPLGASPGETVHFFVSTPSHPNYHVTILRYGPGATVGPSVSTVVAGPVAYTNGIRQDYGNAAYVSGVAWTESFSQTIPSTWESGVYAAKLTDDTTADEFYVTFLVEDTPAAFEPIVVMAPINTWEAYNYWPYDQGGAFYPDKNPGCPDPQGRTEVSFLRPNPEASPLPVYGDDQCAFNRTEHLAAGLVSITSWLEREGWAYSMTTDTDVAANPAVLTDGEAQTLIIPTHSEYWTQSMYDAVDAFLARGGNVAVLSGNTAYREVALSGSVTLPTGEGLPIAGNQTIAKVLRPGAPNNGEFTPQVQAATFGSAFITESGIPHACTPYVIFAGADPLLEGSGVGTGDPVGVGGVISAAAQGDYGICDGNGSGASGWEIDRPFNPGFNRVYEVLGAAEGAGGTNAAAMLRYQRYSAGQVFNVGSITFGQSLLWDSYQTAHPLSTIIENLLQEFAQPSFSDFTRDGNPDVLALNAAGAMRLYSGTGDGAFVQDFGTPLGSDWQEYGSVISVGDFSGDGVSDVLGVTSGGDVYLRRGDGEGGFSDTAQSAPQVASGWNIYNMVIPAGSFAGDGGNAVLARDTSGDLWMYRGDGHGGFRAGRTLVDSGGWNAFTRILFVADFAGIGSSDLLTIDAAGNLRLYVGNRGGGFLAGTGQVINTGWGIYNLVVPVGNFAGDGTDGLLARDASGNLYLYRGDGDGNLIAGRTLVDAGWSGFSQLAGVW